MGHQGDKLPPRLFFRALKNFHVFDEPREAGGGKAREGQTGQAGLHYAPCGDLSLGAIY